MLQKGKVLLVISAMSEMRDCPLLENSSVTCGLLQQDGAIYSVLLRQVKQLVTQTQVVRNIAKETLVEGFSGNHCQDVVGRN